jgi:hypothetical protein
VGWLWNRRDIAGTAAAGGLRETSDSVLAGVRWASPALPTAADWQLRGMVDARVSAWHQLDVDYHGLLDESRLRGARKRQVGLRLVGERPGSPWSWELSWSRLSQGQSEVAPVYRNGVLFGTVRQPALRIEDAGLTVTRRF